MHASPQVAVSGTALSVQQLVEVAQAMQRQLHPKVPPHPTTLIQPTPLSQTDS